MRRMLVVTLLISLLYIQSTASLWTSAEYTGLVGECRVSIVAVSSGGGGVLGSLTVRVIYPGEGKVYISTSPASEVDTQGSARIAAFAASLLAGVDLLKYNFYYDIESPSIIVGGPSAGAAMALATYEIFTRGSCDSDIVATGMIQPDTSLGPVGGLKEKLEATASGGKRVFIIPAGQEEYTYTVRKVERTGPFIRIIEQPVSIDLRSYGEKLGVKVVSASTLEEAYYVGVLGSNPPAIEEGLSASIPQWLGEALGEYVARLEDVVARYLEGSTGTGSSYIDGLVNRAKSHVDSAREAQSQGLLYTASVKMTLAAMYAEEAYALKDALNSNLDVTEYVREANATINNAWNLASNASKSAEGSLELDALLKAYAKAGLASYYYTQGVENLAESGGTYRLPYSVLGGVDVSGLESIITARWLGEWSSLWANISLSIEEKGLSVERARLDRVATLILAQAKATSAYTSALLQEAGAGGGVGDAAVYLVDLALSSDDPIAVIGLSIESIAESTRRIHEVFTLDPDRTSQNLERLAYRLAQNTSGVSLQPQLLIEEAKHIDDAKERLLILSRSILYSWAIKEAVKGAKTEPKTPKTTATPTTPQTTAVTTKTATEIITKTETNTPQPLTQAGYRGVSPLAAFSLGIIVGATIAHALGRRRQHV